MYLIKKGTVAIRKMKGPAYVELARIYSNEVLGELSFFDRLPRSAAAVALTEVEVLEISFDSLDKIYGNVPDYMKTIIMSVADRLRKANDLIRRLQKNVVKESGESVNADGKGDEPSISDALAATDTQAAAPASGGGKDIEKELEKELEEELAKGPGSGESKS